jgi:hypothetical protein
MHLAFGNGYDDIHDKYLEICIHHRYYYPSKSTLFQPVRRVNPCDVSMAVLSQTLKVRYDEMMSLCQLCLL